MLKLNFCVHSLCSSRSTVCRTTLVGGHSSGPCSQVSAPALVASTALYIIGSGRYSFGRVFLDARLYHDPPPLDRLTLDAHLIVRCMLAALRHHQDIRISSRVQTDPRNTPHTWYETFEARTSDGILLEEFGRRQMLDSPRSCVQDGCMKLVPRHGPPLCMEHLLHT